MQYSYEMGDIIDIADTETQGGGLRIRHIVAFERSDLIQLAVGTIIVTLISALISALVARLINPSS